MVIGRPETLYWSMISRAGPTVASGRRVAGIEDDPVGAAFDLLDLLGLPFDGHVLVDDAEPPSWASAMAISLSVTVSIGELSRGMFRRIRWVSWVETSTVGRHDLAVAGFQQHVVERQALIVGNLPAAMTDPPAEKRGNQPLWPRREEMQPAGARLLDRRGCPEIGGKKAGFLATLCRVVISRKDAKSQSRKGRRGER